MPKEKNNKARKNRVKKRLSKPSKTAVIILFVAALLISVLATEIVYMIHKGLYVKVLTAKLEVGNTAAFALGEENLGVINFGTILPGGGGKRFVTAENQETFGLLVNIRVTGSIKEFLVYENNFIISQGETKQIDFEVFSPLEAGLGKYSGRIFLIFKRA